MNHRPIDSDYIREIIKDARSRGLDVVDVLLARQLLLTDERRELLAKGVISNMIDTIELASVNELGIKKMPCTGTDMREGIVAFLAKCFKIER